MKKIWETPDIMELEIRATATADLKCKPSYEDASGSQTPTPVYPYFPFYPFHK